MFSCKTIESLCNKVVETCSFVASVLLDLMLLYNLFLHLRLAVSCLYYIAVYIEVDIDLC